MFEVKIRTGGAAFKSGVDDEEIDKIITVGELKYLLRKIVQQMEDGYTERSVIDTNGNEVGEWRLEYDG